MAGWLELVLIAAAVIVGLWALLVLLAARLPSGLLRDLAGFLPACVTLARRLRADPRVPWQAKAAIVLAGRTPAAGAAARHAGVRQASSGAGVPVTG